MSSPLTSRESQYDIIFAGGGPCSCIAASRLLNADPNLRILIVEYGSSTENVARHIQPGQFMRMQADPDVLHFHVAKPSASLAGRSPIVPSGKAVGGGSSVNFMVYTRASASDYDDWEQVHGNRGWGSDSLVPLLKKAETYQEEDTNGTHGRSGPIKASFAQDSIQVGNDFLAAAKSYDKVRGFTEDLNGFYECDKYGRWARYVDKTTGTRSDVPHHYIYNKPKTPNLTILTKRVVDSVIIENGRAVGIKYQGLEDPSSTSSARATKMVVLGAGAFGSPAILERSGIGSAKVLQQHGIPQVVDLPGVGENYMDHNLMFIVYHAAPEVESLDEIFYGTQEQLERNVKVWTDTRKGLMTHNSLDAGIKMRPDAKELKEMSPEINEWWNSYFAIGPDKPLALMCAMAAHVGGVPPSLTFEQRYFTMAYFLGYPASTGYTHISSKDPTTAIDFHAGFLDNPADLVSLRWAYKKTRELARRMACYRGEAQHAHPLFNSGSAAAVVPVDTPHSADEPDIIYTPEDDACIDDFSRLKVATTWHSCGTCAMKPRDKGGVVDERLNVYGVQGLKVAAGIQIVEYGPSTQNVARHIQPAQFMKMQTDPDVMHFRVAKPSDSLGGRSPVVASGKAVGGGSSVNFMVYTRAFASDYNDWENVHGNRGWGTDALLPLIKKAETYQEEDTNETHGTSGPIKVSFARDSTRVGNDFLDAARSYDKERTFTEDVNGFNECDKYGKWARYIDNSTGTRSDVPHHYIYNKPQTDNLTILTRHVVDSVIIENGRAVGINYQSLETPGVLHSAYAAKMVVLGAGAFGSPAILERSGIGSPKVLKQHGISQVVDLPGVGENYMDHSLILVTYHAAPEIESFDEIFYGTEEQLGRQAKVWSDTNKGLMAHNALDAGVKMRPNLKELQSMSPYIDEWWNSYFAVAPDKPLAIVYTMSAHGESAPPSLQFEQNPADLVSLRWIYKKSRELARRMACYRGEAQHTHPTFSSSSAAAVIPIDKPHAADEADIVYTPDDDESIDDYIRRSVITMSHSCGTCAMKPREKGGVVDENLNVYGVRNLKIADCSIFPGNVGANTYNTAIAIGEKAAIVEYGEHTHNNIRHIQPARCFNLLTDPTVFHYHVGKPSASLGGRAPIVPSGKAVGGGSTVNFMAYTRGAASDYDDWENIHGNKGWGSDSLIPLVKKAETYQEEDVNGSHGIEGPIKVSFATDLHQIGDHFLDAARRYDKTRESTQDTNDFYECNKYGKWAKYVDKETGRRSDVPHHYIYNKPDYEKSNLTILTKCAVDSVIIEDGQAVGVKYQSVEQPDAGITSVRATKLVVLGAGAFGSPAILERSGIGSATILQQLDIPVVVDLPGVGEHYMDHLTTHIGFSGTPDIETLDEIFFMHQDKIEHYSSIWSETVNADCFVSPSLISGLDAIIKIRPDADDLKSMSPALDQHWNQYLANAPDKPLLALYPLAFTPRRPPSLPMEEKAFSMCVLLAYPVSTGHTHITSKDALAPRADFEPGFLDHPADVVAVRWFYKKARELARRMKCYRGEFATAHPEFDPNSPAAVVPTDSPRDETAPDVVYTDADDERIDDYMRKTVQTTWHSCGTCAMKPRDKGGVVDDRLNVYGVEKLKVAEAGKNFEACVHDTLRIYSHSVATMVDGTQAPSNKLMRASRSINSGDVQIGPQLPTVKVPGFETSRVSFQPFMFSNCQLVEGDEGTSHIDSNMGQINITLWQVTNIQDAEPTFKPVTLPPLLINERAKKGIVHGIQLGEEKAEPMSSYCRVNKVKEVVTFIFRYRPISILRANDIAPPEQKSRQIQDDIIDLTIDDDEEEDEADKKIRELKEQLDMLERQKKQKKRKRNPSDAGIKREIKAEIEIDLT
ncbi:hypothetical protein CVT24_008622 [Panaeolus cyanescens]|uniref:pyranose dehydrogenase (acceptor) n=1 Tax=Panaeolus cyanescens TaxID=181874 RepID=A0A409VB76_9AGAR|nr:hypothetical protein CVT24_008622 [Panaeolus cyanescens]